MTRTHHVNFCNTFQNTEYSAMKYAITRPHCTCVYPVTSWLWQFESRRYWWDDCSAAASSKRRCSPHYKLRTARSHHFRPEIAQLASGSQPHSVKAVQHDALHPRVSKSWIPCQPGSRTRRQPASTRTAHGRQHWITAARLKQTSACAWWHFWSESVS